MPNGCGELEVTVISGTDGGVEGESEQQTTSTTVKLPKYKWPSVDHLTDDSVLLLDAGTDIYIWVGMLVDVDTTQALFGVPQLSDDTAVLRPMLMERRGNELSSKVMNVVEEHLRRHRVSTRQTRVHVVKQGSSMESEFLSLLVEDSNTHGQSYVEHLCEVHRQIQHRMNNSGY